MERKLHFRQNWLIFLGICGEAELISRILGAKKNIFRELRYFLSGIWGDRCIIFRDQGSKDPPPLGASKVDYGLHKPTHQAACNFHEKNKIVALTISEYTLL